MGIPFSHHPSGLLSSPIVLDSGTFLLTLYLLTTPSGSSLSFSASRIEPELLQFEVVVRGELMALQDLVQFSEVAPVKCHHCLCLQHALVLLDGRFYELNNAQQLIDLCGANPNLSLSLFPLCIIAAISQQSRGGRERVQLAPHIQGPRTEEGDWHRGHRLLDFAQVHITPSCNAAAADMLGALAPIFL